MIYKAESFDIQVGKGIYARLTDNAPIDLKEFGGQLFLGGIKVMLNKSFTRTQIASNHPRASKVLHKAGII